MNERKGRLERKDAEQKQKRENREVTSLPLGLVDEGWVGEDLRGRPLPGPAGAGAEVVDFDGQLTHKLAIWAAQE